MSNRFLFWILGLFFAVAVTLTGIRVFVAQDYPVLIEEPSEELLDDEDGAEEIMMGEDVFDVSQEGSVLIDSDSVQE